MNIVLLAAGRGSRLGELTQHTHKSLLPVAGRPALQYLLDEATRADPRDVVIVTGHRRDDIEDFVQARYPGRVRPAFNDRYESDTNILSTQIGVEALLRPETGYLIVETDIVMESAGWRTLFQRDAVQESEWATRGGYSADLTGGALRSDGEGRVEEIVYAPRYDARFEGWPKLLGALRVGADQVAADRSLREAAIARTITQYYMAPWVENLEKLPCRQLDLSEYFACSFNDMDAYQRADREFQNVVSRHDPSHR